jgi:putative DNA primase/helicase
MPDITSMFTPLDGEETPQAAVTSKPKSATGTKVPIIPVPADAPPMTFKHPKHGAPSQVWPYHDAEGRLVGYVARFDFINAEGEPDKDVLPITFCDLGDGKRAWRSRGIPAPRPLYRLPDLIARPDAWVFIAEGEKAADGGAILFPNMAATSPMHGAK